MHEPIIRMEDVTKTFPGGVVALDRVSLGIQPGEWVAIMGASGSGKSTLLNLIGCLDRPTQGVIRVSQQPMFELQRKLSATGGSFGE